MESLALTILNIGAISTVEEEIEQIEDAHERETRRQLLEAIWDKISDFDIHILDYEYKQHCSALVKRGIEFVTIEKNKIAVSWEEMFALSVSEEEKKKSKQYNEQYKWHLFSFDLLGTLKEADASAAFDAQAKDTVYIFFQYAEEAYIVKNAYLLKAEDLDFDSDMEKADIYVFDPVEKWTYVKTHEAMCGPYFYQKNEHSTHIVTASIFT